MLKHIAVSSFVIAALAGGNPAWAEMKVPEAPAEIQLGFVPVVKEVTPAVVNIYARRVVEGRASPFADDPFFGQLFRNFGAQRPRVENSLGSGVILGGDGFVVSNYHVVGNATDIRVVLNDGREYDAKVVLADEESDLAILHIDDVQDLPALALRGSDTVEVGELVLAVGNPFGVGQTVSSGIVSGLARSGTATGNSRGYFIQTDAPINPGNSGGALVDINGRLIGINTAILSRSGGSNGIGFAIPAALVGQFVGQARAGETVFQRPWAGVSGQPLSYDMAEGLGLARSGGVILSGVHPSSSLHRAGLVPGDVILAVDGHDVNGPAEIIYRMTVAGIGADVVMDVLMRGERQSIKVSMERAPDEPPRATMTTDRRSAVPGLTLSTINPAVLAEYDLPLDGGGVLIDDPGDIGARAGLRAGDILLGVNGVAVDNSSDASAALRQARNHLALDVQRGQRRLTMRFRL